MEVIKPEAAESNKPKQEKPKKEGYFICRAFKANDKGLGYIPAPMTQYLCTFVVDGESGVICAWEQATVGTVDYYATKMAIFTKLSQAEAILKIIYREGPVNGAIFYRKWDATINRYVTIQTTRLKIRNLLKVFPWAK